MNPFNDSPVHKSRHEADFCLFTSEATSSHQFGAFHDPNLIVGIGCGGEIEARVLCARDSNPQGEALALRVWGTMRPVMSK